VAVVVLGRNRTATLQVTGLGTAPQGKTYEAWVIPAGKPPRPAGLFDGGSSTSVRLRVAVPRHAVVAVTVERAGGVRAPTSTPIIAANA
jgi:anti-sigma-K factor RskA